MTDRFASRRSDCATLTWVLGIFGILTAWEIARHLVLNDVDTVLLVLLLPAMTMALYELSALKVHRRPSTGLDFSLPLNGWNIGRCTFKLLAHWCCWSAIALYYWCSKENQEMARADVVFAAILRLLPILVILSPIYIILTDRYQTTPLDEAWQFGRWITKRPGASLTEGAKQFALSYALRAFFLPWALAAIPGLMHASEMSLLDVVHLTPRSILAYLIAKALVVETIFVAIGYSLALRVLDTHYKATFSHVGAWIVTLICYYPFSNSAITWFNHYEPAKDWTSLIPKGSALDFMWCVLIASALGTNLVANISFGLRFSNLSRRGLNTAGLYRYFAHPSYFAKVINWWLIYLPFVPSNGVAEAVRSLILMCAITLIYYLRGRAEQNELSDDPQYLEHLARIRATGAWAQIKNLTRFASRRSTISWEERA